LPGGAGELAAKLWHARETRDLTRSQVAALLRKAAGEPLARELTRMIWAWETGRHKPSDLHMRAYRRIFPELPAPDPAPDPGAVLDRARRAPPAETLAALRDAALRSGKTDLMNMAETMITLRRQFDAAWQRLEELLAQEAGE
jgi:hypothetical protein